MTPHAAFMKWTHEAMGSNPPKMLSHQEAWLAACAWQREEDAKLAKAKCTCGLHESCAWCRLAAAIRHD